MPGDVPGRLGWITEGLTIEMFEGLSALLSLTPLSVFFVLKIENETNCFIGFETTGGLAHGELCSGRVRAAQVQRSEMVKMI